MPCEPKKSQSMDEAAHAILAAEMDQRWADICEVCDRIEARRRTFAATDEGVEAMGYQLHNLYGACEQLGEVVAQHFENHVTGARYHTDLLRRLKAGIRGVRPALLSPEAFELLDGLRRFRHFFRHAYGARLDPDDVGILAGKAGRLRGVLGRARARSGGVPRRSGRLRPQSGVLRAPQ
jgi:hypothetical protein